MLLRLWSQTRCCCAYTAFSEAMGSSIAPHASSLARAHANRTLSTTHERQWPDSTLNVMNTYYLLACNVQHTVWVRDGTHIFFFFFLVEPPLVTSLLLLLLLGGAATAHLHLLSLLRMVPWRSGGAERPTAASSCSRCPVTQSHTGLRSLGNSAPSFVSSAAAANL
eukprot:COSAG01_NODE_24087_length_791_cov_0.813584_1_plen_166_part_00